MFRTLKVFETNRPVEAVQKVQPGQDNNRRGRADRKLRRRLTGGVRNFAATVFTQKRYFVILNENING
jgi:hypothetical protein